MNSHEREELLSAYLDDELSAEDRARVERWLADDAEYRRLHDELLSLRSDLQALPRHQLREDLAPAVLRRVEQQSQQSSTANTPAVPTAELPHRSGVAEWWSRRSGRTIFWPAVAVAAALMVALFNTRMDERDVALEDSALKRESGEAASPKSATAPADAKLASEVADEMPLGEGGQRERAVPELKVANDAEATPAAPFFAGRREASNVGAMKGAAPAAANAPAPADMPLQEPLQELHLYAETDLKRAIADREQVNLIQCDVTPAFLNENPLEKVLAGNKITYQRYAIPQADMKQNRAIRAQSELRADDDLGYAVQATPEQVETIVTELQQEQSRRRVSNLMVGLQQAPLAAESQSAAKPMPQQRVVPNAKDAQQPVTIYLRKQGAPQQAPAAAPAEAPQP
jgi:anti-sigma factor RsiW